MSDVSVPAAAPAATPTPGTAIDAVATTSAKAAARNSAPAESPAPAPAPKKDWSSEFHEVTSGGKTKKVTTKELLERYPLADTAYTRFEEAAQLRKEAENVLSKIRDPKQAIKLLQDPKLGLDKAELKAAFEDWYNEEFVAPESMSPEQRQLKDANKRIAEFEEREALKKAEEDRLQNETKDSEAAKALTAEIMELIPKSGLPKTKFTASRMAYWMKINESQGLKAPAELIIQKVKDEARGIMDSMLQASDGDVLFNLLGESTAKKLQRYNLEKLRAAKGLPPKPVTVDKTDAPRDPQERLTEADVKRRARELFR